MATIRKRAGISLYEIPGFDKFDQFEIRRRLGLFRTGAKAPRGATADRVTARILESPEVEGPADLAVCRQGR